MRLGAALAGALRRAGGLSCTGGPFSSSDSIKLPTNGPAVVVAAVGGGRAGEGLAAARGGRASRVLGAAGGFLDEVGGAGVAAGTGWGHWNCRFGAADSSLSAKCVWGVFSVGVARCYLRLCAHRSGPSPDSLRSTSMALPVSLRGGSEFAAKGHVPRILQRAMCWEYQALPWHAAPTRDRRTCR